ncbi:hypothetical protein NM0552_2064, partial [Neisseria meningitidis NM0552]
MTRNGGNLSGITENERKSGQGDEAADSTNRTEGEATLYWFLLIHYKT